MQEDIGYIYFIILLVCMITSFSVGRCSDSEEYGYSRALCAPDTVSMNYKENNNLITICSDKKIITTKWDR